MQRIRLFPIVISCLTLFVSAACGGNDGSPQSKSDRLDPLILDYVAPVNGDAWYAAGVQIRIAVAKVQAEAIAPCLTEKGFPGEESAVVVEARSWASAINSDLPSLAEVAKHGILRTSPSEVSDELSAALLDCHERDKSAAKRWSDAVQNLNFEHLPTMRAVASDLESEPVWQDAKDCMTEAGAPPFSPEIPGHPELPVSASNSLPEFDFYLRWVESVEGGLYFSEQREVGGGTDASRAFAKCTGPYFDAVERALKGPRAEFIEKHREELVELQRQFASFDVAED